MNYFNDEKHTACYADPEQDAAEYGFVPDCT